MNMPTGAVKQQQINAAIATVQRELRRWVRHIGYDIGQDWSGQWAIFFRVLLSDEAAQNMLKDVATRVIWRTSERLDLPTLGLFPYFDFRSESEQTKIYESSQD